MTIKEIQARVGSLSNYALFIILVIAWYLIDNVFSGARPLVSTGAFQGVLGWLLGLVFVPFILAGVIGGVYQRQRGEEVPALSGFFAGVKTSFWRLMGASVLSFLGLFLITIFIDLTIGLDQFPGSLSARLIDYIGIPTTAVTLFWFSAIGVERNVFSALPRALKTLLNPYALGLGLIWGGLRFSEVMLMEDLPMQPNLAIYAGLALVYGAIRALAIIYSIAIYRHVKGEVNEVIEAPAAPAEDGLVNVSYWLSFGSFIPLVHLVALILGLLALRRNKQFALRAAIACCLGGFFTVVYLLGAVGLAANLFSAQKGPGYAFLAEANPALKPQVQLLSAGSNQQVLQELEPASPAQAADRSWTVDAALALARYNAAFLPELSGALDDFYTAAKKNPDRAEFYYYYGVALLHDGQNENATTQFKTAVKLNPQFAQAAHYLDLLSSAYYPPVLITSGLLIIILLLLFTLHEYGHAYAAWKLGDDTAKDLGRLTLNPIAHLDLFGSIILPAIMLFQQTGYMFGWAKPVPVDPRNFKDPQRDHVRVSFAGPAVNLLICMLCVIVLLALMLIVRLIWPDTLALDLSTPFHAVSIVGPPFARLLVVVVLFLKQFFYTSLMLGCLNLIPVPPLDGSWILSGMLPRRMSMAFEKIRPFGSLFFILLVVTPVLDTFLSIPLGMAWVGLEFFFSIIGLA